MLDERDDICSMTVGFLFLDMTCRNKPYGTSSCYF